MDLHRLFAGICVKYQNAVLRSFKQSPIAKLDPSQAKLERTFSVATRRSFHWLTGLVDFMGLDSLSC